MTDEPIKDEPIKIDSEDVFDPDLADRSANVANPDWLLGVTDPVMGLLSEMASGMKDLLRIPRPDDFKPARLEHKVRIFEFNDTMNRTKVCAEIEALLNDGYHLQFPVICNDYVMLDFSRRKEDKDNGEQQSTDL